MRERDPARRDLITTFSGTVFRQTGQHIPAFPPGTPAPTSGRYHRAGDDWPLYATLDAETAWAEWHATTQGGVDPAEVVRSLWRLEITDLPVVDLRDEASRAVLSVSLDDLVGSRSSCQPLAERARELGARGLVVPSAARSGAWCLVVLTAGWGHVRVVDHVEMHPAPPGDEAPAR